MADIRKSMEKFRNVVSQGRDGQLRVRRVSDRFEPRSRSVATEGAVGAGLTGLMILLFLRDLRSVLVVVCNIPLALLRSLCGLWCPGNTINIMSLGGMALAIGILVDEATVTIENAHVQMGNVRKSPPPCCMRPMRRPCRSTAWPCCASCRCSFRHS